MSYPAISLTTATVSRHRRPQKRLQTAANLPSTRIRARIIAPVTSSPPFQCPHAVHPCPSVDSGLNKRCSCRSESCPIRSPCLGAKVVVGPEAPVLSQHPPGLHAGREPTRPATPSDCRAWRSPRRCARKLMPMPLNPEGSYAPARDPTITKNLGRIDNWVKLG